MYWRTKALHRRSLKLPCTPFITTYIITTVDDDVAADPIAMISSSRFLRSWVFFLPACSYNHIHNFMMYTAATQVHIMYNIIIFIINNILYRFLPSSSSYKSPPYSRRRHLSTSRTRACTSHTHTRVIIVHTHARLYNGVG